MSNDRHRLWWKRVAFVIVNLVLGASATWAQSSAGIAGMVRDTSGGVLPGVTVEASSDALIEKVRTVTTDGQGLYKFVDLRPGTYVVTFFLEGFNSVRREGIVLTSSFTATVNADLPVGSLQEAITVSGQASTTDVQNVVQQRVLTRDVIDLAPVGTKTLQALGVLIPGVVTSGQDVGGTGPSAANLAIHGSRGAEEQLLMDGMTYNTGAGRGGTFSAVRANEASTQEISIETSGLSAENEMAGVRTNVIPKEGGNTFHLYATARYASHAMQANNLTDSLRQRGLRSVDSLDNVLNTAAGFGGPLIVNKLWFYSALMTLNSGARIAGVYYNTASDGHSYVPDQSRPALDQQKEGDVNTRLTWQASEKHKVSVFYQFDWNVRETAYGTGGGVGPLFAPEAAYKANSRPQYMGQVSWSAPVSNKLLLQAGAVLTKRDFQYLPPVASKPGAYAYTERRTGFTVGNYNNMYGHNSSYQYNTRVAASYVTGAHAARVGFTFYHAEAYSSLNIPNSVALSLLDGVPSQLTQFAAPLAYDEVMKANVGVFAQDQWNIRRLTLNTGVRFDYQNMYTPEQTLGAGLLVPNRNFTFAPVHDIANWKNVTPRLGVAYDVFGNGKTAIKAAIGKYLNAPNLTTFARVANPAAQTATSATRTWNDLNGNFLPDCDLTNVLQNAECGNLSNVNFGNKIPTTQYDPSGVVNRERGYNWEGSIAVQHEVWSKASLDVGVYRRSYGGLITNATYINGGNFVNNTTGLAQSPVRNLAVTPEDYSPYCITAPVSGSLPNGGGYPLCGLYDVSPTKFGQVNNIITKTDNLGTASEIYTGLDVSLNARLPKNITVAGGTSTGRVVSDTCYITNSPQDLMNCHVRAPFRTQIKALAAFQFKWGLQPSFVFQSLPGPMILANYTATNAQVAPSLGRNLSAGVNGTVVVPLIAPGTMYGDRLNQIDFRMARLFTAGSAGRVNVFLDVFNMLNATPVLQYNNNYSAQWPQPTQVLQGRIFKFGAQLDF